MSRFLRGLRGGLWPLFAGALLQTFSAACGGDDSVGQGGDGGSGGQGGSGMSGGSIPCESQLDCSPGHSCDVGKEPNSTGADPDAPAEPRSGFCNRNCSDELCSPRVCASTTGSCAANGCRDSKDCQADEFCETGSRTCRPAAGLCESPLDCLISQKVRDVADISCDGSCQLAPRAPEAQPAPFPGNANLTVKAPKAGSRVQDLAKLSFRFAPSADPGFALILPAPSAIGAEPSLDSAIWGAVLRAGSDSCGWADGNDVDAGAWQTRLSDPPTQGTFYFLVQTVHRGELSGFTNLIPFTVGPAPSALGADCADEGVVAGECANPDLLMGCFQQHCARVCSSNAACEPEVCADPIKGVRYCQ